MAEITLESMQRVFWYVQSFEKDFARKQMAAFGDEKKKELDQKRKELTKAKKRAVEIDRSIQKIYEDNVNGKMRGNCPRAIARRNGRTVPRAYAKQEIPQKQQNSVAAGLHCLHNHITIF